jgi:hypothetical protein
MRANITLRYLYITMIHAKLKMLTSDEPTFFQDTANNSSIDY